jgi:hypothetical protein
MEYKTRTLRIKVQLNDIVEIVPNKDWSEPDTLELARENVIAMKKAVDGKGRGLLSHTSNTYLSKEVLKCYSQAEIGEVATAMLTTSFGSKIVGNLFLKLLGKSKMGEGKRGKAPIRIFDVKNKNEAIEWLLECIKKNKAL